MEIITIKNVRGYIDEKGIAFLNLEDVARGLGFVEIAKSGNEVVRWRTIRKYLLSLGIIATSCDGQGKENLPEFIPENIFYKLCMKANNETARKFQDLVCDEILPSIRKNGMYATDKLLDDPEFAIKVFAKLKEEKEQRKKLEDKIEKDKPRVGFAKTIEKANKCILIREFSKILANEGIILGEKKLYKWLRDHKYILKYSTEPMQSAVNKVLFKVHKKVIYRSNGAIISTTTKITGKGQIYFLNLLKKEFKK